MKLRTIAIAATAIAASMLMIAGCGQASPAPTATAAKAVLAAPAVEATKPAVSAPAVATKAAEPVEATKPASMQPTAAASAARSDFPVKGKPITLIVPYDPGGVTDVAARLLVGPLEQALGTQVVILNKPGSGTQIGLTELAKSKPDGYTMGYGHLSSTITTYLDPRRQAVYDRKSFQALAAHFSYSVAPVVKADSPYKTAKDLIEAAEAGQGGIKAGTTGIGTIGHQAILHTQRATQAKFSPVMFNGDAPSFTALMGGHVDVVFSADSSSVPFVKRGDLRPVGEMDKVRSPFFPDTPTFEEQGYKAYCGTTVGIYLPAGTPKDVVDTLATAMKKAMEDETHKAKMKEMGYTVAYLGPDQFAERWSDSERQIEPLMPEIIKGN